jgi:hypothetical protein
MSHLLQVWSVNLTELADEPMLYVRCQESGGFVLLRQPIRCLCRCTKDSLVAFRL